MTRQIKFRGRNMNDKFVYGLLTKKKIRSSGKITWAIATDDCSAANTIPISDDFAQLVGLDKFGNEVYEGDPLINDIDGTHFKAAMNHCQTVKIYRLEEEQ